MSYAIMRRLKKLEASRTLQRQPKVFFYRTEEYEDELAKGQTFITEDIVFIDDISFMGMLQ